VAVASAPDTAARWASERALDLWVVAVRREDSTGPLGAGLALAAADGAAASFLAPGGSTGFPQPFAIFDAMRTAGIDDVRRTGLVSPDADALLAGRRAGLGAVIAVAEGQPPTEVLAAEPDRVVAPGAFGALDAELYGSDRNHRPRVLLNPGPALTSERVKRAAAGLDLCHREPEYAALRERVVERLRRAFGLSGGWQAVLLAGSGTAAVEAMVAASTRPGRRLLVCRNGVYGDRLAAMAERAKLEVTSLDRGWCQAIDPDEVEAALARDETIDAVALVHHETTTGLLNPAGEIAERVARRGRMVVLDAVSSLGGEELALDGTGISMVACSANKCLHGLPGLAFVLLSPAGAARARETVSRSVYLDLSLYLDAADHESVPFTPAVPVTYALEAALDELLEEGPAERRRRYRERVALLDRGFARLGLEQLLSPELRSSSIRSVALPPGVAFADLHDPLREDGYVIYAGQGDLGRTIFRVATLGNLELPALEGFCRQLEAALERARPRA
jgi:2-aminoethylphosphonate-pyruvate transaminase